MSCFLFDLDLFFLPLSFPPLRCRLHPAVFRALTGPQCPVAMCAIEQLQHIKVNTCCFGFVNNREVTSDLGRTFSHKFSL